MVPPFLFLNLSKQVIPKELNNDPFGFEKTRLVANMDGGQ